MNEKLEINKKKKHVHQLKNKSAQKVTKHQVGEGMSNRKHYKMLYDLFI